MYELCLYVQLGLFLAIPRPRAAPDFHGTSENQDLPGLARALYHLGTESARHGDGGTFDG